MDPNANLKEQINLARELLVSAEINWDCDPKAERLAELVLALHEWITRGNFLPKDWEQSESTGPDSEVPF